MAAEDDQVGAGLGRRAADDVPDRLVRLDDRRIAGAHAEPLRQVGHLLLGLPAERPRRLRQLVAARGGDAGVRVRQPGEDVEQAQAGAETASQPDGVFGRLLARRREVRRDQDLRDGWHPDGASARPAHDLVTLSYRP
jgi:hypothetical protein